MTPDPWHVPLAQPLEQLLAADSDVVRTIALCEAHCCLQLARTGKPFAAATIVRDGVAAACSPQRDWAHTYEAARTVREWSQRMMRQDALLVAAFTTAYPGGLLAPTLQIEQWGEHPRAWVSVPNGRGVLADAWEPLSWVQYMSVSGEVQ